MKTRLIIEDITNKNLIKAVLEEVTNKELLDLYILVWEELQKRNECTLKKNPKILKKRWSL